MAQTYDLIVAGGGISGLGVAYQAAQRGLKVVLLEKGRCASATSNNSLRIIHGGFRYLQTLNLARAKSSLTEQQQLLNWAKDYIRPLACVMPLGKFGLKSKIPVAIAGRVYRALAFISGLHLPDVRVLSAQQARELFPAFREFAQNGLLNWSDAELHDPAGFSNFLLTALKQREVEVLEGAELRGINSSAEQVEVNCVINGKSSVFVGKYCINALGPWINSLEKNYAAPFKNIGWCKAYNVVFKTSLLQNVAIGLPSPSGRLFFFAPRAGGTAVGTWYVPFSGSPDSVLVTNEDVIDFLREINSTWTGVDLTFLDIERVESGVLPMLRDSSSGPVLYGSEKVVRTGRVVEVLSTKYTTFLNQGRKALELTGH